MRTTVEKSIIRGQQSGERCDAETLASQLPSGIGIMLLGADESRIKDNQSKEIFSPALRLSIIAWRFMGPGWFAVLP